MPSLKDNLIILVASLVLGLIGALPLGLVALFFGGAEIARDLYLLAVLVLASWFPLKLLIDSQVKGQLNFKLPKITLNRLSMFIVILTGLLAIGFLYWSTLIPFFLAALFYRFSENSLVLSAILGLGFQVAFIYRGSQREKAMGVNNRVFMRVQDFSQGGFSFELDPSQVTRQTPRQEQPQIIYLPEDNLREHSHDSAYDDDPMIITIDPDAVSEQSDDET